MMGSYIRTTLAPFIYRLLQSLSQSILAALTAVIQYRLLSPTTNDRPTRWWCVYGHLVITTSRQSWDGTAETFSLGTCSIVSNRILKKDTSWSRRCLAEFIVVEVMFLWFLLNQMICQWSSRHYRSMEAPIIMNLLCWMQRFAGILLNFWIVE